MGSTQSKIDNEEVVARCKERKHCMKEVVTSRYAFAAAHTSYATYLKNTGAALNDFINGEVQNFQSASGSTALPINAPITGPIPSFEIPRPPPPLPEIKMTEMETTPVGIIVEEEEENEMESEGSVNDGLRRKGSRRRSGTKEATEEADRRTMPPPPSKPKPQVETHHLHTMSDQPQQNSTWEYLRGEDEDNLNKEDNEKTTFEEMPSRLDKDVEQSMNNEKNEVPDPEAAAPEPTQEEVGEPPEPSRVALATLVGKGLKKGTQGQVSMEGKRSVKSTLDLVQMFTELYGDFLKASESAHEVSAMLEATRLHYHSNFADSRGKDDFDYDENETHATILDKLLAWEKKLYDEVKAGEIMKFEYQRKVASLDKLKKRGTNIEALEKAKASVSELHTRFIVDMRSLNSTVSEINSLRDKQLYPGLVRLVDGMATMWKTMHDHHENQSNVVILLKSLDSPSPTETTEHHHDRTYQLLVVVQGWCSQFEKLVTNQKGYIKALNKWLRLNLIPIESNLKEKVSSPPRVRNPPIQGLIHAWQDHLEKLPDELARTAISNFAAMVEQIFHQQQDEMALKRRCEESRKELSRKTRQFEDWYHKYLQRKIRDEPDQDRPESINATDEIVVEKQFLVEQVKRRLEDEEDSYARQCVRVRQKSLASLKNRLPEFFRAMSDFALGCCRMYSDTSAMTMQQNLNSRQAEEVSASFLPSSLALEHLPSTFTYEELELGTCGFSQSNFLGQGGFGIVHKGILPNKQIVAIKQQKSGSKQGMQEFLTEVNVVSQVRHKHLVSLVGYCIAKAQRTLMLVYEFVPNKTLDFHLYGKGTETLDWSTRMKIANGSAKGLMYLHEECELKIIHRDIKAANILLDNNFEPKIADFGLAKLSSGTESHVSTAKIKGTFGYLAPEYANSGKLSEKADVFSFGVVLLELITGRKPVLKTGSFANDSLVEWARPLLSAALENRNFEVLGDPRLQNNYNSEEMFRMASCAANCVRHSPDHRPPMSQVVAALTGKISLDNWKESTQGDSEDLNKFWKQSLGEYSGPTSSSEKYN